MRRIKLLSLIILLLITKNTLDGQIPNKSNVKELNEKQLVNGLSEMDPEFRGKCAVRISELLLNGENVIKKGNIIEHTYDYWMNKINRNKSVMKKEDFEREFFEKGIDFIPNYDNVKIYQLDNFHMITTEILKKKIKLKSLTFDPTHFNFDPDYRFSGTWKTYYVLGSIHKETEYTNGIKNGVEIIYNWRGHKRWLKIFENGVVKEFYGFKDGEKYEADMKLLEVEG